MLCNLHKCKYTSTSLICETTKLHNSYFRGCLELAKLTETRLIKVKRKRGGPRHKIGQGNTHCGQGFSLLSAKLMVDQRPTPWLGQGHVQV